MKAWYILKSIVKCMWFDLKITGQSLSKPKELINLFFILFIVNIFLGRYENAVYSLVLVVMAYIWKIIRQGDWRKMAKDDMIKSS